MTVDLEALDAEVGAIERFLESLSPGDWERPTRCPPMTVRVLAGHLLRHPDQFAEYPREDAPPEKDAVTYYRYDPADLAAAVVSRAQERAGELPPRRLLAEWRERWPAGLRVARSEWERNPTLRAPLGLISLRDFALTRIVEATVHHMDLRDALGREPDPTPNALTGTVGVLEGLLGAPAADAGMAAIDFVLSGTGRRSLTDSERARLGPLATKFPLLA